MLRMKFELLVDKVGTRADVFLLISISEDTKQALAEHPVKGGLLAPFDQQLLPAELGYPYFTRDSLVPGSAHFPVLDFHRRKLDYEHYFVVEFDVEYTGDWGDMVTDVTSGMPDFASLHFFSPRQRPNWKWWRDYQPAPRDRAWALDRDNLRRSFNPIYCISRRATDLIDAAHHDGWRGHNELLLATILTWRGCRITDLGNYCKGREQDPKRWKPVGVLSTVRWRPPVTKRELLNRSSGRTLFHPVKDPWVYNGNEIVSPETASQPVVQE